MRAPKPKEKPAGPRKTPRWLKITAAAALVPVFCAGFVFAALAILPPGTFARNQVLVQVGSVLPAAVLAWVVVRKKSAKLLAVLIPVLLVVYVVALNMMTP